MNDLQGRQRNDQQNAQWMYNRLLEKFGQPTWRAPLPAIDELVSTILSQNTNDRNRDVAFERLRNRFPTWEAVRDADVDAIIDAIRPAGLGNQKGKRIKAVLQQISREQNQLDLSFLSDWKAEQIKEYLLQFKGVGYKTAAIVMQFSLGIPAFPVDTHIYRVSGRFGIRPAGMSVEDCHSYMEQLFKPEQYEAGHLNIIRLGREICQARKPQCTICPLNQRCAYFAEHPIDQVP
ncbi:MAG: endonuclease III [Chloroflexi bacterium]|nr:endonuclease III [Chloroflexota bacterium]